MTAGPPRPPGGEPGGAVLGHTAWVALLIWLGVCGVVFLPYELVERRWLGEFSPEARDLAHLLRGVAASLLATLATSAYLLRRAVPRLELSLGEPPAAYGAGVMAVGRGLASWMLGLRWVAAFAAAAVVIFASLVSGRLAPESMPQVYAGVLLLLGFNAMLAALGPRRLASQRALALQVAGDVLILGWLTHFAGGMRNPFAGFFVFHAVIAAVILEPRPARGVALGIAAFVLSLTGLELAGGPFAPGCLLEAGRTCAGHGDRLLHAAAGGAVATMVVVCGLIVSALVRVLRAERDRLAQATARLAAHAESLAAAQTQVQRERANLQSLIDCMADAVIYVAPDGAVRLHNQAAARFWPTGTADSDLRACHAPESWRQLMERVANPAPIEVHPVFAVDGRTYEASYARVDDVDGSLRGVVMVARDVTERIEAQNWRM